MADLKLYPLDPSDFPHLSLLIIESPLFYKCPTVQVEVTYPDGSPADRVTIRIKAELTPKDNVYTSELVSRNGLVEFEIPSIPTAAQYVWLEVGKSSL